MKVFTTFVMISTCIIVFVGIIMIPRTCDGFVVVVDVVVPHHRITTSSSSLLMGGFLDGRAPKIDIRDKEDDAMWIEDENENDMAAGGSGGGWNPFAPKKTAKASPPPPTTAKASKSTVSRFGQKKKAQTSAPTTSPTKSDSGFKFPWDK